MGAEFSDDKKKKRKYNSKMNKDYIIIIKKSHSVYSDREAQKWLNWTEQTNIDKMEESQEKTKTAQLPIEIERALSCSWEANP